MVFLWPTATTPPPQHVVERSWWRSEGGVGTYITHNVPWQVLLRVRVNEVCIHHTHTHTRTHVQERTSDIRRKYLFASENPPLSETGSELVLSHLRGKFKSRIIEFPCNTPPRKPSYGRLQRRCLVGAAAFRITLRGQFYFFCLSPLTLSPNGIFRFSLVFITFLKHFYFILFYLCSSNNHNTVSVL